MPLKNRTKGKRYALSSKDMVRLYARYLEKTGVYITIKEFCRRADLHPSWVSRIMTGKVVGGQETVAKAVKFMRENDIVVLYSDFTLHEDS